jgi:Carboxypeptidase regulatory-like domain
MPQITRILPMVCAIALLHIPGNALDCCFDGRPPCQAYWASDAVFVGEVKDIEIAMEKTSDGKELRGNVRVIFSVTEAFRGVSSTEIKVSTSNSECGFRFETGGLYFVYASIDRNGSGGLTTSSCTRTQEYSESSPDLIYARSLTKAAPGAAIFGRVTQRIEGMNNGQGSTSAPLPNVRIIIEGQEKKFNPKTDEEGRYSMSGLTPGDYTVKIDLPEGLDAGKEQKVQVYERGCAKVDFEGRWDGKLSGTVIDAEGRPVKGVGVYLVKAEKLGMDWMISSESNDDGHYELSGIQPGRYREVISKFKKALKHSVQVVLDEKNSDECAI